jgi:hypothetical protein
MTRWYGSPTAAAGRVTYWTRLASLMKDAMKLSPHWACSTWASLVTLLGDMYLQADFWKEMNEIVLVSVWLLTPLSF